MSDITELIKLASSNIWAGLIVMAFAILMARELYKKSQSVSSKSDAETASNKSSEAAMNAVINVNDKYNELSTTLAENRIENADLIIDLKEKLSLSRLESSNIKITYETKIKKLEDGYKILNGISRSINLCETCTSKHEGLFHFLTETLVEHTPRSKKNKDEHPELSLVPRNIKD